MNFLNKTSQGMREFILSYSGNKNQPSECPRQDFLLEAETKYKALKFQNNRHEVLQKYAKAPSLLCEGQNTNSRNGEK